MRPLAFCSIAFRDEPVAQVWQRVAEIGYDAIELFWGHLERLNDERLGELAAQGRGWNCPALVLSPYLCFTRGGEEFEQSLARLRRVVHAAHILGATKIRTFVDVGPTGIASAAATEAQWADGLKGLRMAAAMDRELTFLLETHENTLADCSAGVQRICDEVAAPNLKLLVHPDGHGDFAGMKGYHRWAARIDHMHLKNHTPDGEATWVEQGVFDHAAFFADLAEAGYAGSLAVEYCWRGATWQNAADAHAWLRDCLARAGR